MSPDLPPPRGDPDPAWLNRLLGRLLQGGLALAIGLLAIGLVDYLLQHPDVGLLTALGQNPITGYLSPAALAQGIWAGHAQPVLVLGVLVLVTVTVLRVAIVAAYFAGRRERESAAWGTAATVLLLVALFVIGPLLR